MRSFNPPFKHLSKQRGIRLATIASLVLGIVIGASGCDDYRESMVEFEQWAGREVTPMSTIEEPASQSTKLHAPLINEELARPVSIDWVGDLNDIQEDVKSVGFRVSNNNDQTYLIQPVVKCSGIAGGNAKYALPEIVLEGHQSSEHWLNANDIPLQMTGGLSSLVVELLIENQSEERDVSTVYSTEVHYQFNKDHQTFSLVPESKFMEFRGGLLYRAEPSVGRATHVGRIIREGATRFSDLNSDSEALTIKDENTGEVLATVEEISITIEEEEEVKGNQTAIDFEKVEANNVH